MKKTSFAVSSLILTTLVLAGCFGTKTEDQENFTIAPCNDYVKLMRCVAEKSNGGTGATAAIDQAIAAWKTLPEDQLTQTCTLAMGAVASNASAYTQLGCEVPTPAAEPSTTVTEPTIETGATAPIETGSTNTGEADAAVVEAVVNEVTSGTTDTTSASGNTIQ